MTKADVRVLFEINRGNEIARAIAGSREGTIVRINSSYYFRHDDTGEYVRVSGREVLRQLGKKVGRKPFIKDGVRVAAILPERMVGVARSLGNGNLSEGLRKALEKAASAA